MRFKELIREKYKKICSRADFINIRKELRRFDRRDFEKELNELKQKKNPFLNIIRGNSKEFSLDLGKYILIRDHADDHYLLLPKDTSYFNILTLEERDIPMLQEMKDVVNKYLPGNKVLFFHSYPFNSVHTLHMHIVDIDKYRHKNNNMKIDDVIFVLKNEKYFR